MPACRLYATNTAASVAPTTRGTWTSASAVNRALDVAPDNTTVTTAGSAVAAGAAHNFLRYRFVSPAFTSAGTISGTLGGVFLSYRSVSGIAAFVRVHAYVMTSAGAVRGTLVSNTVSTTQLTTENTGAGTSSVFTTASVSSVAAVAGDRLVVEQGTFKAADSSASWTVTWGAGGGPNVATGGAHPSNYTGFVDLSEDGGVFSTGPEPGRLLLSP